MHFYAVTIAKRRRIVCQNCLISRVMGHRGRFGMAATADEDPRACSECGYDEERGCVLFPDATNYQPGPIDRADET